MRDAAVVPFKRGDYGRPFIVFSGIGVYGDDAVKNNLACATCVEAESCAYAGVGERTGLKNSDITPLHFYGSFIPNNGFFFVRFTSYL